MVNKAGHAFQTCRVKTSTNRVQLKTKYLQQLFCLMRQNRHSTKMYVVHRNTLSDSFWIRIVWFQPKQDSDRIRISFLKNRIGSDSENPLSDHLWRVSRSACVFTQFFYGIQ